MGGSPSARTFINCHGDCFVVHDLPRAPAPRTRPSRIVPLPAQSGQVIICRKVTPCLRWLHTSCPLPPHFVAGGARGCYGNSQPKLFGGWTALRKGRSLASEGRGHRFEPCRARQQFQKVIEVVRKPLNGKLTKDSPTKRLRWRMIGRSFTTVGRRTTRTDRRPTVLHSRRAASAFARSALARRLADHRRHPLHPRSDARPTVRPGVPRPLAVIRAASAVATRVHFSLNHGVGHPQRAFRLPGRACDDP
jgi:hypothetical protein